VIPVDANAGLCRNDDGSFRAVSDSELLQDMTYMHLDRDLADVQGSRDFGVCSALRY
jgi:hypothetical protein